ncbi:alpha/beta fold hydrolase [Streptomyces stelliscabiei]|uniref:alpha/beta fold hydrolase n=1 Tax=Streptomyces stelliscabiei TaxID=146820 RepID=UPI0029B3E696|nr:alpha/beta hydrolase [Streptomyces stelliscabiei]MDX2550677.1 alpha/beta hydrolase [Streptomyces stelliscabiei]MDX2610375.1 alpha/beta hydrolase [Streptomyces stelliscabiei]MDX2634704.1 alpha/beta hydrolase [Streptomyces stelliscabiei]MDX2659650.1 alpha/beta hydrolase [Streptomyces stelliscabiei]MDX2715279.1 alpha/beta hydrolase [Streptomyces stelliscabiei]
MPQTAVGLTHRLVPSPAGRIHLVEQGSGPLVLLVHGFPESWYSWRHQLSALAEAGYRAVAVDVRGYGRSSRPGAVDAYRMLNLVEDGVAVVHALGERAAVIVGHDWGATIAANSALLRPDVFSAVGLLSVPYAPPGRPRPSEAFAQMGGAEEFYVSYFQHPGRAEAEIEPDVRGWLAGFYAALSADTMPGPGAPDPHFVSHGGRLRDRFPAGRLPSWLGEHDLDVYAAEFERTGMAGALVRYRNMDRDWEDLVDYNGAPITQPSLFVGGALDASTAWMADAIKAYPTTLPGLVSSQILAGCGHWIQQERPEEINRLLTDWLASLPA